MTAINNLRQNVQIENPSLGDLWLRRLPDLEDLYINLKDLQAGSINAYLFAMAMVLLATLARLLLPLPAMQMPLITFFPAVMITTFICGMRAGLASIALSALSAWYVIALPLRSAGAAIPIGLPDLFAFAAVAGLNTGLVGLLRRAARRPR